jgi:hypothetical protein
MEFLINDAHGIYVPQIFATEYLEKWNHSLNDEDIAILKNGPDEEFYWEVWETLMNDAEIVVNDEIFRLWQDGDLWALGESDIVDDLGHIYDAKETPFATPETIEWNCENKEGFEDSLRAQEWINLAEYYGGNLGDALTYHGTPDNKAIQWALKNYDELEFCFEHNPSWYCSGTAGEWDTFSDSWLSKDHNIEPNGFDGIYVTTLQGIEEIEIQAENGDCHYISDQGYFKVLARVTA